MPGEIFYSDPIKIMYFLVNSEAIAIILACFLYLTIYFKVGWSMFSNSQTSEF